jgi:hypothetical protein
MVKPRIPETADAGIERGGRGVLKVDHWALVVLIARGYAGEIEGIED